VILFLHVWCAVVRLRFMCTYACEVQSRKRLMSVTHTRNWWTGGGLFFIDLTVDLLLLPCFYFLGSTAVQPTLFLIHFVEGSLTPQSVARTFISGAESYDCSNSNAPLTRRMSFPSDFLLVTPSVAL
jgi:hypothetical protein